MLRPRKEIPREVFSHHALFAALVVCLVTSSLSAARPGRGEQTTGGAPKQTPEARPPQPQQPVASAATIPQISRERREQAYTKMLEGQRYLARRSDVTSGSTAKSALQAFQQAAELDPTLAEARTAMAEIAFFVNEDFEQAEREATAAARVDRNNFGAHRILSRVYTLRSGLRQNKPDRNYVERAITELREVARLDSNDAESWALLGELYQATNRDREAIDAYTRWAATPAAIDGRFFQVVTNGRELSPDAAAARLGEVLMRAGRTTEAVAAIRRAIALDPENDGYLDLLVRALQTGNSDGRGVVTELQRMVAADPKNAVAVSLLAGTEVRAGRIDDAVATLRAGIARRAANDRSGVRLRRELAQLLADALRYDEAIVANEELLKALGVGSEPLTAEEDRETVAKTLTSIINLQQQAGRPGDALASVERMRRLLGADDPNADLRFIELLREQGKRREALQALRTARERYPDQEMFVRLEAVTLAELGRVDEGAALLRGQLKGSLGDYPTYLTLSSIYLQAGRGNEAVEAARKALELAPPDQVKPMTDALLTLSSAQERAGDAKGSEESLRRILVRDPNNATALNNLGYFLLERNERLAEALEMIQRAVKVDPHNASFLDSLGWAYYKLNRLDEAERYLSEAARRDLTSATVQEHLGDVYHRRGRIDQARAAWQKALTLTNEAAETARIKAKLSGESRQR